MAYLDDAVLDGIHKRLERVLDREVLRQRLRERLEADRPQENAIDTLRTRLAETRRKIDRLIELAATGPEDLPSLHGALVRLERGRQALEAELAETTARRDDRGNVDGIADALIEALSGSREVLEAGDPEERKRLVRAFIREIEIRKPTRREVLSWYRLPAPENLSVSWWPQRDSVVRLVCSKSPSRVWPSPSKPPVLRTAQPVVHIIVRRDGGRKEKPGRV